jgi:hypothetical protein
MSGNHSGEGKILQHGAGLGVPSPEMVRQRARELALIDGRAPEDFTDADWSRARRELHGGHDFQNGEDAPESAEMGLAEENDHRVAHRTVESPESLGEELIAEGMDEAVHEQMLEARREADADDS